MRIQFRQADALIVFTFGTTSNKKIAQPKEKIVQTYSFSRLQYENAKQKTTMRGFFELDGAVCMDCPFSVSNGAKLSACYTHKVMQYSGFLSSLKSIAKSYPNWDDIPTLDRGMQEQIVKQSYGKYVRFGSYGEPSLIPIELVRGIVYVSKSWTGYTHQWNQKPEYAEYLMASVHTAAMEEIARRKGWRSFIATPTKIEGTTNCPASKEQGFKSHCSKCGLCSGTKGKGNKSVYIIEH
jgi:hypothetical protein